MNKVDVLRRIREVGLIPVVRADSAEMAHRAVMAVRQGGIPIVEITMTVPGAIEVIRSVAKETGSQMLIGAGTVLNPKTARECVDAGAQFIVSPTLHFDTIAACKEMNIAVMPGALTPTEILAAWTAGADLVKVFPAGAVGGPNYFKALRGPFPNIKLIPTGGVSLNTAAAFIEAGAEALGVGTDLIDNKAVKDGLDAVISERARQYVEIVGKARATPTK